jgi:hypothetical protein
MINEEVELQYPTLRRVACPKNSTQKAVKQNIKTSTELKYTSRGGAGTCGEVG